MAAGAAMTTPNPAGKPTPVPKISGMKIAITAIQTQIRPTVDTPANRPTSKLSGCRRDRPLLRKETPTGIRNSNANVISPMTNKMARIRGVSSRSVGLLSVALCPMASALWGFHVPSVSPTIRLMWTHHAARGAGRLQLHRRPGRCP